MRDRLLNLGDHLTQTVIHDGHRHRQATQLIGRLWLDNTG